MNALLLVSITLSITLRNIPALGFTRPVVQKTNTRFSRISIIQSNGRSADEFYPDNEIRKITFEYVNEAAWVLIFDANTPDEGVYMIQENSENISILTFETFEDAHKFALQLTNTGYEMATPTRWDAGRISRFCEIGKFQVIVVPYGKVFAHVPADTTQSLDAQRRQLEFLFPKTPDNCTDEDCTSS